MRGCKIVKIFEKKSLIGKKNIVHINEWILNTITIIITNNNFQ